MVGLMILRVFSKPLLTPQIHLLTPLCFPSPCPPAWGLKPELGGLCRAYMAVLARMEESMACSSVRAEGRLW